MRLTCLKCGHQIELASAKPDARVSCVCGQDYTYPQVSNTVLPDEGAAERSRRRAFQAAGVVKNVGGFALGISLLGLLFPPFGLVGAAVGIYVLTMLRGPVGRYSGRRYAIGAVALGVGVFVVGGMLVLSFFNERQERRMRMAQDGVSRDMRSLLRAQRLFRASNDRYGSFGELGYTARYGGYTIYLSPEDWVLGQQNSSAERMPLPAGLEPGVSPTTFTAVATANLDSDPALDVWILRDSGDLTHAVDDVSAESANDSGG